VPQHSHRVDISQHAILLTIMFTKHAETVITRQTPSIGNSLRVGEAPRVQTSIRQGGGRRGGDIRRVTRTDRVLPSGIRTFNTGALNTGNGGR
jgi:hypothetical protein